MIPTKKPLPSLRLSQSQPPEIIEIAPCISDKTYVYINTIMKDYLFRLNDKYSCICFGYGSFYSHNNNPNCTYKINNDKIYFTCIKPIEKDEEICISYGDDWWNNRKNRIKKID